MRIDEIIQAQVNAYNERNLAKMMTFFAADIELFDFADSEPMVKGITAVEKLYKSAFEHSPDLHAEILNRIVFDDKVIDLESVITHEGVAATEVVVIYEFANSLISKVYFHSEKEIEANSGGAVGCQVIEIRGKTQLRFLPDDRIQL
jgi:hypothetical protein